MNLRIYVDFNARDEGNVVIHPSVEIAADRKSAEGKTIVIHDEELEVNAQLKWEEALGMWVAIPNWSTIKYF